MGYFNNLWQSLWGLERWDADGDGQDDFFIFDPSADFSEFSTDLRKIQAVFSNPAVLKVFKLQCDMYSLSKTYVYRDSKSLNNDPVLNTLKNPNPFQSEEQFKWDYMFWKMIGNAYCYIDSDSPSSDTNKLYFLDPSKIQWPDKLRQYKDKIVLSDALLKEINDCELLYTYDDGSAMKIKWGRVCHVSDLTNGTGNWFKGRSTIDALHEIIANSKESIRSKNVNVRYAGKYMVAGKNDVNDVTKIPLGDKEKFDIERKTNSRKTVTAVKSMVDIKRFVETASIVGELDESYFSDYFKIGQVFGIKKDVLDASLKGSTFENQAEATGSYVEFTLAPSANLFYSRLAKRFSYTTKEIVTSWDHLSFMQLFEKRRAETVKIKSETLLTLMKAGVKIEEINVILDTNFTILDYEAAQRTSIAGQQNEGSAIKN